MSSDTLLLLGSLVLVAGILHWVPLWRRRNLWFGVTVPPEFRDAPESQRVLGRYRIEIWLLALVAAGLSVLAGPLSAPWLPAAAITVLVLGASGSFAMARRRIRPYAERVPHVYSASLATAEEGLPGGVCSLIGPLGVLAAAALYLYANWQQLPERYPVHWGASGQADRWAHRSLLSAGGPLLAGLFLVLLLLWFAQAILRSSPRARVPGTAEWTYRFRRVNLRLLVVTTWGISLMMAWIALLPLFADGGAPIYVWAPPVAFLAVLVPFIWQMVRISQEPGSGSDGTPDECWKLGQFYYNPNDPALIVEKRFGLGYTLNFGNPTAWWFTGLLAAIILVTVLL